MGSSYSVEVAAMNAMMGFIVMIVFVCLAGVAAQVLLGLATYNDAKACWWAFWAGFPASSICACAITTRTG